MKLYIAFWCFLLCMSCVNSNVNEKKTSMGKDSDSIKIEFYLYPTGNFNDIRYSLIIDGGMLTVENHDTVNGTKIPHDISTKKLSSIQIEKIEALVKETKFKKEETTLVTEDTWGCKLIANDSTLFESTCFTYESLKDRQNLITYILSLLPVKLELYGFS